LLVSTPQKVEAGNTQDLVNALLPFGPKGTHRQRILEDIRVSRQRRGVEIIPNFSFSVQSAFNDHNRNSAEWKKKRENPKNALFYFPGYPNHRQDWWAVDAERAEEWMAEHPSVQIEGPDDEPPGF
jgi:hypothetical protein